MASEPELWAARDQNGSLFLFDAEPERQENDGGIWQMGDDALELMELRSSLLPDLKPGEKCRVRLVTCEDGE